MPRRAQRRASACILPPAVATAPAFLTAVVPRSSGGAPSATVQQTACTLSLDVVLEMVRRTAGDVVDADAPLMEAGIDSLGAVDLRNQLQSAASGSSLPSTLVFDHPTARRLSSFLQPAATESTLQQQQQHPRHPEQASAEQAIVGLSTLMPDSVTSPLLAHRAAEAIGTAISLSALPHTSDTSGALSV